MPNRNMSEGITLVSSTSVDTVIDEAGKITSKQAGGPALFIGNALESDSINYNSVLGNEVEVEILLTGHGEYGRIINTPTKKSFNALTTYDWTILSTIIDEWVIKPGNLPKRLCLDIQGYVRDGEDFGRKQLWSDGASLLGSIYCLKGTKQEIACLPREVLEDQKQRVLVVTDGERGAEIYYKGTLFRIPVAKIDNLIDTIGAGDTFFGHFVAAMFRGKPPEAAGIYAAKKTTQFLRGNKVLSD